MKKVLMVFVALSLCAIATKAQDRPVFDHSGTFFIAAQGGASYSVNENYYTYRDAGKKAQLFQPGGGISVGYWFNPEWGVRLAGNYGHNRSALNLKDYERVSGGTAQFCPYEFKSITTFVDVLIDVKGIKGNIGRWRPIIFGGIGYGHSFDLGPCKDSPQPYCDNHWQWAYITDPNNVVGIRFGGILEYTLPNGLGFFGELTGEAYTDRFNGLQPTEKNNQFVASGIAGFPFDCRAFANFGVSFHF